jgi:CheY-like chemotaxis protein
MPQTPLPRKPTPPTPTGAPMNSLGLSMRDLDAVLDRIDAAEKPLGTKRAHTRRPFRRAALKLHVEQPGGTSTVVVAGRNLSTGGMCVLHRSYLHVGTECRVDLPLIEGGTKSVRGKVVRCTHREGVIHDVGIKFVEKVTLNDHDRLEQFSKWLPTLERVDPAELHGSLLLVDGSAADARLVRHLLGDTKLNIVVVGDRASAVQRAAEGFDVILTDFALADGDAGQLIADLAAKNISTPVIVSTAETDVAIRAKIATVAGAAFVAKPFEGAFLLRLLAEFVGPAKAPPGSDTLAGASFAAVLNDLLAEALKIQSTIATGDCDAVRRLCVSMRATAQALNLQTVYGAADLAVTALTASMSVDQSASALSKLVNACVHAAGKRSQAA